jgi:iron-sulfur cluster assembly accessory protein
MPRRWNRWRSADPAAASKLVAPDGASYLAYVSVPDIILTENAAKRVAWIASRQSKPAILRLAVDGGGCAGFTYTFDLADRAEADDSVAETDGVKLVVDPLSLELVKGSAVDFVEDLGGAAFRVTNPNAQSGCGCGSSFSV